MRSGKNGAFLKGSRPKSAWDRVSRAGDSLAEVPLGHGAGAACQSRVPCPVPWQSSVPPGSCWDTLPGGRLVVSLQLCANPQNQTQGGVGSETAVEAPILSDVFTLGPTDNQPNSWAGHFSAILSWGVLNALLLPEHAATLLFVPLWVRCLSVGCTRWN